MHQRVREAGSSCGEGFIVWVLSVFSSWSPRILSSSKASLLLCQVSWGCSDMASLELLLCCLLRSCWGNSVRFCYIFLWCLCCPEMSCKNMWHRLCPEGLQLQECPLSILLKGSGAAFSSFSHNVWGIGFLRLVKTTGERGTEALRCLFDMAYLEV